VLLGVGWMLILEFARGDVPLGAPGAPSLPPSPLLP
jgi:hypothetical protein